MTQNDMFGFPPELPQIKHRFTVEFDKSCSHIESFDFDSSEQHLAVLEITKLAEKLIKKVMLKHIDPSEMIQQIEIANDQYWDYESI